MKPSSFIQGMFYAIALVILATVTGCASTEQMQKVETRVDSQYQTQQQIQKQLADQHHAMDALLAQQAAFQKQLTVQWQTFAEAYSPHVRAELEANLKASTAHRDAVLQLKKASTQDREQLAQLRAQGLADLAIIKQNRQESDVVNVVNQFEKLLTEFNALNRSWDKRIQVMQEETVKHSAAVQSSTHAATLALAESRHASEAAKAAKDSACEVSLYTHRIRDMEQQLKKALREMDKLDDDLKNQRRENQTLKNRLQDLEKKIQTH